MLLKKWHFGVIINVKKRFLEVIHIMRINLLPERKNAYKANLHCHSTISDGNWTPEQIKENYKAHGYSVVAYTDHAVFIPHNDLADESFLPLNGFEFDVTVSKPWIESPKTCHICFIALDENEKIQHIYYNSKHTDKNLDKLPKGESIVRTHREYTPEFISKVMTEGREKGFFVTYNHPQWSQESKEQYCSYHGMHAMEIVNYSSVCIGNDDRNGHIYDQMLREGERIFCIATDDNHDSFPMTHPQCDSFGGFTVILADELKYTEVTKALTNGDFYASEGPEIKRLYVEDGIAHIETSDAARIIMQTGGRFCAVATAETVGKTLNAADFKVDDRCIDYIRFTVCDGHGKEAYTNAYFLDTLPTEALTAAEQ